MSGHIQVDFVLVTQSGHSDGVDECDLVQGEEGWLVIPVMKAEAELLGEEALQGDEIKAITHDGDGIVLHLHGFLLAWGREDETFLTVTP